MAENGQGDAISKPVDPSEGGVLEGWQIGAYEEYLRVRDEAMDCLAEGLGVDPVQFRAAVAHVRAQVEAL